MVYSLVKSVFGKTSTTKRFEGACPSLPSFLFSELEGPPYPHIRTIHTKVRGVTFKNGNGTSRQQIIRQLCHSGDALLLLRDRDNPADPNAIAIIRICRGVDGKATFCEQLGYLAKEIARDLAPILGETPVGFAEILEITGDLSGRDGGNIGVNIRAEVYLPSDDASETGTPAA